MKSMTFILLISFGNAGTMGRTLRNAYSLYVEVQEVHISYAFSLYNLYAELISSTFSSHTNHLVL